MIVHSRSEATDPARRVRCDIAGHAAVIGMQQQGQHIQYRQLADRKLFSGSVQTLLIQGQKCPAPAIDRGAVREWGIRAHPLSIDGPDNCASADLLAVNKDPLNLAFQGAAECRMVVTTGVEVACRDCPLCLRIKQHRVERAVFLD